nr:hypothetical protein [Tanacetum cinerariifolium]
MESVSPQVESAAKLPILNPNEFDLWKMRIEQYFLMTDYSLWEVILNGDSPDPTRFVEGVLQPVAPTTAEQRLARKNESKAREKRFRGNTETKKKLISQLEIHGVSLSQEDVNLKFIISLPSEWRTHTLIWRNKTDFEEHSLDDLFNSLKIYEAEVRSSSSVSTTTQNLAFVSSSNTDNTNEQFSAVASVSVVSAKLPVSALPNVDSLSNVAIYSFFASQSSSSQLDNDDLKQIDADDLKEMDLKWKMAKLTGSVTTATGKDTLQGSVGSYDWSFQAEKEPTNYALMAFSSSSYSSDNEVVSCSKSCTKAYAQLQSHYDKLTADFQKSQFNVISYQTGLESIEARLLVYQQNESIFEEDIKLLKLEVQLRDNALVSLRQTLEKAEQERDDLKLKLEKFQTSSKNLTELLDSQTNVKTGSDESLPPSPIYDMYQSGNGPAKPDQDLSHTNRPSAPIIEDWVFDSKDESKTKPLQNVPSFVQPTEQVKYPSHSIQHVETSIPPKTAILKTTNNGKRRNRKECFVCKSLDHLIKDCDYHEKKMAQPTAKNHAHKGNHKPVSTAVPKISVTRPRQAKYVVTKTNSPPRKNINRSPSLKAINSPPRVTAVKAPMVNAAKGNMSYLSDFKELNSGYVAFGGNPKGGKISGKGKIKTGKLDFDDVYFVKELKFNLFRLTDENQVLLRVPRENNMYNVNLKNIVPSGDLTCLFTKAKIDETNLWHRRLGHINFKTMNKLVKDSLPKFDGKVDEGFLVVYSICSKAFRVFNRRTRIFQEILHVNFLENKPNVVGSGPTWLFDIDTLTKTMNYQLVTTGNQSNPSVGVQKQFHAEKAGEEIEQQYVLFPVWSFGSTNPQYTDGDVAFNKKEHEFDEKKLESKVNVSPSRYRNLSAEFEDLSNNNINEVNAAGTLVLTVGQNSPNSTNTFSAASPSNAASSPTHRKYSFIDASQLPDDPEMPELEDLTDSDDEDDVGAAADFNNLETSITDPDHPDKVYKVVKALYGLHQAPRDWYETLANYLLENGFQIGKIDQKLFIKGLQVKQKKDGIFICQDKYVAEILKKFRLTNGKSASTPIDTKKPLLKDPDVKFNDVQRYTLSDCIFLGFGLTLQVVLSSMESLQRMVHVINVLSAGYLITPQMVLNSPCLTHIKKWLVQIKRSLFWTTVAVKKVNDIIRLQALFEKKKVVVTEDTIRDVLRLDDAEGVECFPNEKIFAELARMSYEKPSIKLTFYKAFFSSQWKFLIHTILQCMSARGCHGMSSVPQWHLLSSVYLQVAEGDADEVHGEDVNAGNAAEGDVSVANDEVLIADEEPSIPSPTPPTPPPQPSQDIPSTSQVHLTPPQPQPQPSQDVGIFVNLLQDLMDTYTALTKRVEHLELDKIAQALEITKLKQRVKKPKRRNKVNVLKLRRLQKVRTGQRIETSDDTMMDDVSNQGRMIAEMDKDADVVLEEAKYVADNTKVDQDAKVDESVDIQGRQAESQVEIYKIDLYHANKVLSMQEDESKPSKVQEIVDVVTTAKLITKVVTAASTTITAADDKGKGILVEKPKPLKKQAQIEQDEKYARELEAEYQALKRKPQTEAQAMKNMMIYLKNVAGFKMDYFEGLSYDDIRPIFEAKFNTNVAFLHKTKEQIDEEESKALKRINETTAKKAAKRQKLDEEVEELKRHLQIVPNEEDDVHIEATLFARKVPVVEYVIINQNNKPYYKIKRADGSHQLYLSFLILLRNFDIEDLEAL